MNKINTSIVISGLLWLATMGPEAKAQVSLYNYSESVEAYTNITETDGGFSMGTPAYFPPYHNLRAFVDPNIPDGYVTNGGYLSPAIGPGYPIGFNFTYNGDVFDRLGIAHGGWVSFGKSSDGNQAVWCFTSDHPAGRPLYHSYGGPPIPYQRNRIAAFGTSSLRMMDLSPQMPPGPVSSLRIATIGTAPNRVCVIQWKDFRNSYDNPALTVLNFQIRLYETTNVVEVRFGPTVWKDIGGSAQVGLGGRTNEDFNSRMTVFEEPAFLYDWNYTVAGLTNEDACTAVSEQPGAPNGSGIKPEEGRTFRWTPPACPAPAWPATVSSLSFDGALVSWPSTGSTSYDYFVSSVNDITGPEAGSGTVSETEVYVEGLEAMTTYYIFVRSYCNGVPGDWGLGTPFTTHGGGYLACPGTPIESTICSEQYSTYYWSYVSDDGFSPVKIDFLGGYIGTAGSESFAIWNGNSATGPAAFAPPSGDLAQQTFTSTGPQIFIRLITDAGACTAQPWYLPLHWRVGCKNCSDPLATFNIVDLDCAANEYSVEVNLFSLGSATTLILQNTQGIPTTEFTTTGLHTVGPFTAGESVVVTLENSENPSCYNASTTMLNAPCAVTDCGPTEYTLCYGDNDVIQRAYQAVGTQEIGIRFLAGTMGLGDIGRIYNGIDPDVATSVPLQPSLNNLYTSGTPSTDHSLVMELVSDNSHSCLDEDPLYGTSEPWRYVVACYDGCTQPSATFASTCLSQTQYQVVVTISELGNTGTVSITNNGGAPTVTATALGAYTVGPFTAGTAATIEVNGANVLCTWTSPLQNPDCSEVGITEYEAGQMSLFPNPTTGIFRVELPSDMTGRTELIVLDVTGRMVTQQVTNTSNGITMDLGHLPNGLYTVIAQGGSKRKTAKFSIQH